VNLTLFNDIAIVICPRCNSSSETVMHVICDMVWVERVVLTSLKVAKNLSLKNIC